ncbi:MAG: hypothetical protein IJB98_03695 [Clostridia bacterium]|nr:hypothetical protein [Clostridia bacterium]
MANLKCNGKIDITSAEAINYNVRLSAERAKFNINTEETENAEMFFNNSKVVTMANIVNLIYPVGSIYISAKNVLPEIFVSANWEPIEADRALWTTTLPIDEANVKRTIEAGLPNIMGSFSLANHAGVNSSAEGCFETVDAESNEYTGSTSNTRKRTKIEFDASKFCDIYGKANTVQPPAYRVYAWIRMS